MYESKFKENPPKVIEDVLNEITPALTRVRNAEEDMFGEAAYD